MDQPTPEQPRRGKARERQRRRRERKQSMASPLSSATKVRKQLRPSGSFEMPKVDARYARPLVMSVVAIAFMVVIIIAVGLFKNEPEEPDANAIWLGRDWTYETHDDEDVRDLVRRLQDYKIGTVYALVSELNVDGTWTGSIEEENRFSEVQSEVSAFVEQFKRFGSDIQIYGTVIFRIDLDSDGYRLDSPQIQRAVVDLSVEVVTTLGFDGVFLQIDPLVADGDENFPSLLRQVRQAIGEDPLLAVTIPPDWTPLDSDVPRSLNIAPGTVWDTRYKQRIALLRVDQMVIRAYDSYMTADDDYVAGEYIAWVAYQVKTFAEAVASIQTDTRLLIAISTADSVPSAHDVRVENVPAALIGVAQGLDQAGEDASVVQGIAIFADWTTSDVEWTQFEDNWLDRR